MPAYFGEVANACALDRRMQHCGDMFGWKEKFPVRDMGNGKVRAAGIAMSMQGSGISGIDVGSVTVKLNDDGGYMLLIAAADMGTGCDTILAQMVAEHMECPVEAVSVFGADIDASPYDSGSYASSTTYVTGMAVVETVRGHTLGRTHYEGSALPNTAAPGLVGGFAGGVLEAILHVGGTFSAR